MAAGHDNQLARQIGEHLVAAELGRQGFIAAPFAGNVQKYDLLAANADGLSVPVQVKAIRKPTWQLDASQFLQIEKDETGQKIIGLSDLPKNLICVYVWLEQRSDDGKDTFYIFPVRWLQEFVALNYVVREPPKNISSTHFALHPREFPQDFKNDWSLFHQHLGTKQKSQS